MWKTTFIVILVYTVIDTNLSSHVQVYGCEVTLFDVLLYGWFDLGDFANCRDSSVHTFLRSKI